VAEDQKGNYDHVVEKINEAQNSAGEGPGEKCPRARRLRLQNQCADAKLSEIALQPPLLVNEPPWKAQDPSSGILPRTQEL